MLLSTIYANPLPAPGGRPCLILDISLRTVKIAINTTSAVAGGGVTYLKNLLVSLSKLNTTHRYLILTTRAGKDLFFFPHPRFTFLSFRMPSKNTLLRLCWEQFFLPRILKRKRVTLLFSPANVCPLLGRLTNVVMIQNIEPFSNRVPEKRRFLQRIRLKSLKLLTILSVRKARTTIFPSLKARSDIEKSGVMMRHAEVIYHSMNRELFHPFRENDDALLQCKKKYQVNSFILFVSNIQRYKNVFELIRAFVLLRDTIDNALQLVLAGTCPDRKYYNEMKSFIIREGYERRILFLGNVPYEDLPHLYAACTLFVYPSTCESFGMTLVEAMACGAPVLASDREPMQEICADAAIYFDPMDPTAIADVIRKTIRNHDLLSALKINSLERAKAFSWENTARDTLKALTNMH
ncbi:MAG: glycosyltransferase family 4 protein [Candidatus Brocadia sp.]|nr:MAG: glycosyltransferase family 4 protein [Candidatus Brocadia sp.]